VPALQAQTGHPVRSRYRQPGEPRSSVRSDVIIVAPATYNTINKWAGGVSDNYALGILAEAVGLGIPVIVLPFVNSALAAHPAYQHSLAVLKATGVRILSGDDGVQPHPPGSGGPLAESFPWHLALDAADACGPAASSRDAAN
jgi:phosphopantothenoylcysteine synthetase/decarboxylase